ncbi:MAG: ABC transporter substrate-binding protein [Chloroflexi bacterium]|nr:ABC transporter substrate-binding protein [Chloroflexota bacterium]
MIKYFFSTLVLVLLISSLLTACQKDVPIFECTDVIGCVEISPGEPIKIGVLQALSGDVAILGTTQSQAIELAIDKRGGQLFDHPIALQIEDSKCTAEGGDITALKIVADPQMVAILGPSCSGAATTASKVMSEAGLVMVAGSNTAPSLTAIAGEKGSDWQPGYFRTSSNGTWMGQAAATVVSRDLGITLVATINDGDAYTRGLTDAFGQVFTKLGGEIVIDATINKGETNMYPVLQAVAAEEPELIFMPLFQPEGDLIVLQAKEIASLENIALFSDAALLTNDFIDTVGEAGLGMYFIDRAVHQTPIDYELRADYEAKYGELPQNITYMLGYDATNLLLHAIESVAIQKADGTLYIGRQALRDALYATTDFEGASGTLTCDEFGDCGFAEYNIMRLDDLAAGVEGVIANTVYTFAPGDE